VMSISGNRLAESIARVLFERARESARYHGGPPSQKQQRLTLREHEAIFAAIEAQDGDLAEQVMDGHIIDSWQRRRPPDHRGTKSRG
jgi:DNA-binding FadR family transcriptional regulator